MCIRDRQGDDREDDVVMGALEKATDREFEKMVAAMSLDEVQKIIANVEKKEANDENTVD